MSLQRTFDFDMATLNHCIDQLKPKRLKTVFRGLLFAAAQQPWLVDDIDSEGYVILTAPVRTVASWAGVTDRAVQMNVDSLATSHPRILEQSAGVNSASQWLFNLHSVLPGQALDWFVDLVETSKSSPRTNEKFTPNFCTARGELLQKVHPKVRGELSNRTSMCLVLNTASLASLAGCCEKFGVAVSCTDGTWEGLVMDPDGLQSAAVVDSLYELATTSGTIPANKTNRNRWFTLAAIASRKNTAWGWFRSAVVNGWLLTTIPNNTDAANGRKLRRQADELQTRQVETVAAVGPRDDPPPGVLTEADTQRIQAGRFARFLRPRSS